MGEFFQHRINKGKGRFVFSTPERDQHATLYYDHAKRIVNLHITSNNGHREDVLTLSYHRVHRLLVLMRKHAERLMVNFHQGVAVNPGWFKRHHCFLMVIDNPEWMQRELKLTPEKSYFEKKKFLKLTAKYEKELLACIIEPDQIADTVFTAAIVQKVRNGHATFNGWVYRRQVSPTRWQLFYASPKRANEFRKEMLGLFEPHVPLQQIAQEYHRITKEVRTKQLTESKIPESGSA